MKQKLILVFLGSVAFIGASVFVSILQMIVGGFLPNTGPDPAAKMEPTPQQRARQEYQQAVKDGRQPPLSGGKSSEQVAQPQQETQQQEPAYVEQKPQQTDVAPTPKPEPEPVAQPTPAPAPAPPAPRGPGNMDAPEPPAYYRSGSSGPGNM